MTRPPGLATGGRAARRRPPRAVAAVACALMALAWPQGPATAQSALTAELQLHDPVSDRAITPDGGTPVRLRVTLRDPATGRAPRGVDLLGWVRPTDPRNPTCAKAAQNFRTTRKVPMGAVDLNGILVASLNRDASLSVVDPKLNLFSSNLVAAHKLDAPPAAMAVDRRTMRAVFAQPTDGRILAARLTGPEREVLASDLPGVQSLAVASSGTVWAGDGQGGLHRLAPDGRHLGRIDMGLGAVTATRQPDPDNDVIGAYTAAGRALMADGATGHVLMQTAFSAPVSEVSFLGEIGAIAVLRDAPQAELRYADAPDAALTIPLGAPFARIATGPDARIALAYTPGDALVAIIDLALGQVVQSLALNAATVSAVTFTDNAAFLLSHDGGFVGAIDLATVQLGKAAVLRQANLGVRTTRPELPGQLLLPLLPSPQVLAIEPENQTGWLLDEVAASVEMPPMNSIRLRGGVPQRVHMVDRSFREETTGVFETVWAFAPGEYELVLTTYGAQISTCVPFRVRGPVERLSLVPVRLEAEPDSLTPLAGAPQEIAFRVTDDDGAPVHIPQMTLLVPSMVSGWATQLVARADSDGVLRTTATLPHAGPYAVQPMGLPAPFALKSALVIKARPQEESTP